MCRAMIIHKKANIKLNMGKKKKKVVTRKPVVSGVVQKMTISHVIEIYRPNIKSCRPSRASTTSLTTTTCTGSKMLAL